MPGLSNGVKKGERFSIVSEVMVRPTIEIVVKKNARGEG
jgi:hypothetical protein